MTPINRLTRAATLLWGGDWAYPMAGATGVNIRTLQRIKAADDSDGPESAEGALLALKSALERAVSIIEGEG